MHSHNCFSTTAEEMDSEMNTKSLSEQAAALAAELKLKCPHVELVREFFDNIEGDVEPRCLRCSKMHKTGLMEQVVKLALVQVVV